jgi:sensor histidine kinase YesM
MWRWKTSKRLLLGAAGITVVISMFEIKLDPWAMAREVASNFVTSASITFVTASMMAAFDTLEVRRDWKRIPLLLAVLAGGGMLGGLVGWGLNELLFPYNITHPHIYLMIVAALAMIFGMAMLAYENIVYKLEVTASRLAEKEVVEQKLLRLRTEAQLEALRARVNPHFLFNTLNTIASLIPEDPDRAEKMVQKLSNLFHYILSSGEDGWVSLGQELEVVREYLDIEKVRLGERLDYSVEQTNGCAGVKIPAMLLQPLVENSIKYGISPRRDGGSVAVGCRLGNGRCRISISDTGEGFDPESTQEGFGIGGVRRRLELYYPGDHQFAIVSDRGVTVRLDIPVRKNVQNSAG